MAGGAVSAAGDAGTAQWTRQRPAWAFNASPFRPALLPDPADFYRRQGVELLGAGSWRKARCLFHADESTSARIHARTGAYRCPVCGTRAGDVLAFYRLRHGGGFVDAARALGAWVGAPAEVPK